MTSGVSVIVRSWSGYLMWRPSTPPNSPLPASVLPSVATLLLRISPPTPQADLPPVLQSACVQGAEEFRVFPQPSPVLLLWLLLWLLALQANLRQSQDLLSYLNPPRR